MIVRRLIKPVGVLSLSLLFFYGCTNTTENASETQSEELVEEEVMFEEDDMDVVFPSLLQIATIFKRSGLDYTEGLANKPENVSQYESQMSQSFNFGVYSADLAYCVLNNQTQKSILYLNNVQTLSDKLGLSSVFSAEDLFASFEKNINNQDSLLYIISNLQERLDEHLQNNEMDHMSSIYFTGGWVEAMYMATQSSDASKNSGSSANIIEQALILDVILSALNKHPQKDNTLVTESINALSELKTKVDNFAFVKDRPIEEIPLEEIVVTDQEVEVIATTIAALRNKFINS